MCALLVMCAAERYSASQQQTSFVVIKQLQTTVLRHFIILSEFKKVKELANGVAVVAYTAMQRLLSR